VISRAAWALTRAATLVENERSDRVQVAVAHRMRSYSGSIRGDEPRSGSSLSRVPYGPSGREAEQPEGWPAWTPASGSSGQDALSIHPASRPRPRRGGTSGSPFSWLLLFGETKRSNPLVGRRAEARRRRARSRKHPQERRPLKSPTTARSAPCSTSRSTHHPSPPDRSTGFLQFPPAPRSFLQRALRTPQPPPHAPAHWRQVH